MAEQLENEYNPDIVTAPGETLRDVLEALGMTKAELAARIGKTPKTVGEIINHNAPITPAMAMRLEKALATPASFWNNRERRYRESLARAAEKGRMSDYAGWFNKMPVREMIRAGWIRRFSSEPEQIEEVLRFFGVASPKEWERLWLSAPTSYRNSKVFAARPEACSAWLRRGELEAQSVACRPFDKKRFRAVLGKIRLLTRETFTLFRDEAVRLCAEAGVAVAFVQPIKGAPIYGATRWLGPQKALIQLSLRGKFEDQLWFTFFHEAGHILLHGKREIFIETERSDDLREQEADRFASDFLIAPRCWRRFIASGAYQDVNSIRQFADNLQISPAIVVGRLQHEGLLPYNRLNRLRRRFDLKEAGK